MARAKKSVKNTDGILSKPVAFDELPTKKFEKTSKYIDALSAVTKKKQWFLIAEFDKTTQASGIAQFLRRSQANLPKGAWDFATRTLDSGKVGLFAQIVK